MIGRLFRLSFFLPALIAVGLMFLLILNPLGISGAHLVAYSFALAAAIWVVAGVVALAWHLNFLCDDEQGADRVAMKRSVCSTAARETYIVPPSQMKSVFTSGSYPASHFKQIAASRAVRVKGPTWSSDQLSDATPARLTRP